MDGEGADVAIRKNLLDRLLNSVKQVEILCFGTTKRGRVFADSAVLSAVCGHAVPCQCRCT